MSDHDHATAILRQAQAALTAAAAMVSGVPALDDIHEVLDRAEHHRDDVRRQILNTFRSIQSALLGADPKMAMSYGLGRLLSDTTLLPHARQPEIFAERFDRYRLSYARRWLDDLSPSFHPRAAAAVTASLNAWETWIDSQRRGDGSIGPASVDEHAVRYLRSQGELWRRLLSGEQDPMQLLGPHDYVDAGERLLQRGLELTARYLRRWWLIISSFIIATGAAICAALIYAPAGTDRVTAVIISVAAALGLSWKGTGATLGKALSQTEAALWASEVDVAVEKAATILPRGKLPPPT
jgi:hypothetical protein